MMLTLKNSLVRNTWIHLNFISKHPNQTTLPTYEQATERKLVTILDTGLSICVQFCGV